MNDLQLWHQAALWAAKGHTVRLATVSQTWGSAPCPVGSAMMVRDDGQFVGSVSGGCVEGAVLGALLEQPDASKHHVLEFNVSTKQAWEVGLACGGDVHVLLWPVFDARMWEIMASHMRANQPCALTLNATSNVVDAQDAKTLFERFGVLSTTWLKRSAVYMHDGELTLTRAPRLKLIIGGAVHIAQALCTMALCAGFECVVVDPRTAFAQTVRFETAVHVLPCWPQEVEEALWSTSSAVIAVSHDPKLDDPLLMRGFASRAFYVGALGSTRNQARRQARLTHQGASPEDLARLDGPIGLDIGAIGAPEIAVSILAGVIQAWRQSMP